MKSLMFHIGLIIMTTMLANNCNSKPQIDRKPAVAGQFYPADSKELRDMLKEMFTKAKPSKKLRNVVAIISPHAGYVFSGIVSASAFNQIDPNSRYENVFVIASSHHVAFDGASVYSSGNFLTPLGTVKVNTKLARELIDKHKFFNDRVDAHLHEHSLEVQLPFLQYRFKEDIQIVPIVIGTQSADMCRKIASALLPYFNGKNLFVVSSDFSHYPSYNDAVNVDKLTADAIISNSPTTLLKRLDENERKNIRNLATSLCGWTSVLTLLYLTHENPNVLFHSIHYQNSGDSKYGEKDRVVGYYAIAVELKEAKQKLTFELTEKDKKDLLTVARKTIELYVKEKKIFNVDTSGFSKNILENCGAFVTLHKEGELRGCIGRFDANDPLYKVVQQMAISSATEDYRFPPVTADEVKKLEIEISVLTPMRKINSIDEIEMGRHGIYIKKGFRSGTFLPQVATETGWSKEEFLGHCARDKAGIGWDGWKDAEIFVYEAIVFSESQVMK